MSLKPRCPASLIKETIPLSKKEKNTEQKAI
jgi:hypothetical protein